MSDDKKTEEDEEKHWLVFMLLGISLGGGLGLLLFKNIAIGSGLGLVFGVLLGILIDRNN